MSARAPAGILSRKMGKLVAVCISATKVAEVDKVVTNQTPATFCIQVPRLETRAAVQILRNNA